MKTGITAIYPVEDLGTTPARVNRKTGELYINMKKWADLSPEARLFVLLHEAGHVDQDTTSEILADNYAFYAYARAGKPLSKSVQALTRVLTFNNPQHFDRVQAQLKRAFSYDYHVNGNPAANPELLRNTLAAAADPADDGYNNFLHLLVPKKVRQQIKGKIQADIKKHKDKKKKKKEDSQNKENAQQAAAQQAAAPTTEGPAASLKSSAEITQSEQQPGPAPAPKSKKGLYIAGAAIILIIALASFYFLRKKR